MNPVFNKLHHICIVVPDIDAAQTYYESIGIGPWINYPPMAEYTQLQVPSDDGFKNMKYRVCNLPSVQLQLCEPSMHDSPQRQFLDRQGSGVFHIGFEVPDADAAEAQVECYGVAVKMKGRRDNGSGFSYYDTQEKAGVVLLTRETPNGSKT